MGRRTFKVIDVVEMLVHWYSGRSKTEVACSLGIDRRTVRKYVAAAERAGYVPGGPPVSEEVWRRKAREWFPELYDARRRTPTWRSIAVHHEAIKALVGVVPASVIHQRLRDENGLEVSVASLRRYVRANFEDEVRRTQVVVWRPEVPPGDEAQVDYGYLGAWFDPTEGRNRRVWGFSMVLAHSRYLFLRPVIRMDQAAWSSCHVAALEFMKGVPRRIVPENVPRNIFVVM